MTQEAEEVDRMSAGILIEKQPAFPAMLQIIDMPLDGELDKPAARVTPGVD
jgi:hypothetical protein